MATGRTRLLPIAYGEERPNGSNRSGSFVSPGPRTLLTYCRAAVMVCVRAIIGDKHRLGRYTRRHPPAGNDCVLRCNVNEDK